MKTFTAIPESPLEQAEACDSNRLCDNGYRQRVARVPYRPYFSVDSPADVALVEIGAQVIKFKPMANMLGYDSIYRLDFIEGRMSRRFTPDSVTEATTNGIALATNPGLDVHRLAEEQGGRFGIDAQYGSATYQPMGDRFEYVVNISQDALIARPSEATKTLIQKQRFPGYSSTEEPGQ